MKNLVIVLLNIFVLHAHAGIVSTNDPHLGLKDSLPKTDEIRVYSKHYDDYFAWKDSSDVAKAIAVKKYRPKLNYSDMEPIEVRTATVIKVPASALTKEKLATLDAVKRLFNSSLEGNRFDHINTDPSQAGSITGEDYKAGFVAGTSSMGQDSFVTTTVSFSPVVAAAVQNLRHKYEPVLKIYSRIYYYSKTEIEGDAKRKANAQKLSPTGQLPSGVLYQNLWLFNQFFGTGALQYHFYDLGDGRTLIVTYCYFGALRHVMEGGVAPYTGREVLTGRRELSQIGLVGKGIPSLVAVIVQNTALELAKY